MKTEREKQPQEKELEGNIRLLPSQMAQTYSSDIEDLNQPSRNDSIKQFSGTLDEPIMDTIMRDLRMILYKLKYVLLPRMREENGKELRKWDLWGPLLLCLLLAVTLSFTSKSNSDIVFGTIFVIIWAGGAVVTLNAKLLKGKISFFQTVCVLGYCVFPINLAALIVCIFKPMLPFLIRLAIVGVSFVWATISSIGFMSSLVNDQKKILAVYPVCLFYLFLSWYTITA